jgi:endogenous inhibitor of DNA gyrase (YacG/DUF329 family)
MTGETPKAKPCAVCGKPRVAKYAPFCSPRCADIDLGRWLKGSYVIPGEPAGEDDDAPAGAPKPRDDA